MAGLVAEDGGVIIAEGAIVIGNGGGGLIANNGGIIIAERATVSGNRGDGAIAKNGGHINLDGGNLSNNSGAGAVANNATISVSKNATIENNGYEQAFDIIGIDDNVLTEEQLKLIIEKVIQEANPKRDNESLIGSVLDWAGTTAILATIAGSDSFVVAVSAVVAFGVQGLKALKEEFG
jgi:hypothetical protein